MGIVYPNAFLKYNVLGEGLVSYEVIEVRDNLIEFLRKTDEESSYLYIDKNRRYWYPREMLNYLRMGSFNIYNGVKKRYRIEELKPIDYFTDLWIDITRIKLGAKIPMYDGEYRVSSRRKIGNKPFYVISSSSGLVKYYSAKTGLLYRSMIGNVFMTEELYVSWIDF